MTLGIDDMIKPHRIGWFKGWTVVSQIRINTHFQVQTASQTQGQTQEWVRCSAGKVYRQVWLEKMVQGATLRSLDLSWAHYEVIQGFQAGKWPGHISDLEI